MATRKPIKSMKDGMGKVVRLGDVVRWRDLESQQHFNNSGQVVDFYSWSDETYFIVWSPDEQSRHKLPFNVRKMSDTDAMLWKLENL